VAWQKGEIYFPSAMHGHRATKFIYEKQKKMYFETHSTKNTASKVKSPKFIYGILLLPSVSSIAAFLNIPT
jgi:hypothetical protein